MPTDEGQAPNNTTVGTAPGQAPGTPNVVGTTTGTQVPQVPQGGQEFDAAYVKTLRAEAADNRTKLRAAEAKLKALEDADLTETDRMKKQAAADDTEKQRLAAALMALQVERAVTRAASKVGIAADLAVRLINPKDLEFDEDGNAKNADKLLAELVKLYPNLAQAQAGGGVIPATPKPQQGGAAEVSAEILRKKRLDPAYGAGI